MLLQTIFRNRSLRCFRFLFICACLAVSLVLSGCGSSGNTSAPGTSAGTGSIPATAEPTATPESTPEPTPEPIIIGGTQYTGLETELDLSALTSSEVTDAAKALERMPELTRVFVSDAGTPSELTVEDIITLQAAAPDAVFEYSVALFGQTFSISAEELSYTNASIGDEGLAEFERVFPAMKRLSRFVLDDCGTSNERMAELREKHADRFKVVWRVHWDYFSTLTDTDVIRATNGMTDHGGCEALQYCTEVKYIDMGHNLDLSYIDFVRYMPELRIFIIVDAAIKSLEPLSTCKNLELLEIVNCYSIDDLSPLAECTNLRLLNISKLFKVKDISPLYGLTKLERLFASLSYAPEEQWAEIRELLPDCWITFGVPELTAVSVNYSIGWRLDSGWNNRAEWYEEVRKIFGIGYYPSNEEGWFSMPNTPPYEIPYDELVYFAD